MDQTFLEGMVFVSFYMIGAIGLIVAGEIISRVYERISRAADKRSSSRSSSRFRAAARHKALSYCSCNTLSVRFKG